MRPIATAILEQLSAEDDPAFWVRLLERLAQEASPFDGLRLDVGACSHWLRPHQRRWVAAGGFAAPYGYGRVPEVAWKVELQLDAGAAGWVPLPKANAKITRKRLVVAAPSRTARHAQAAVHTLWPKGTLDERRERMVFYGFRKVDGLWTLKANSRKD